MREVFVFYESRSKSKGKCLHGRCFVTFKLYFPIRTGYLPIYLVPLHSQLINIPKDA